MRDTIGYNSTEQAAETAWSARDESLQTADGVDTIRNRVYLNVGGKQIALTAREAVEYGRALKSAGCALLAEMASEAA